MYAIADILHAPFWMHKQARDEKENELLSMIHSAFVLNV
jgi:hypothetical protein